MHPKGEKTEHRKFQPKNTVFARAFWQISIAGDAIFRRNGKYHQKPPLGSGIPLDNQGVSPLTFGKLLLANS
jgi:hypothetical protein